MHLIACGLNHLHTPGCTYNNCELVLNFNVMNPTTVLLFFSFLVSFFSCQKKETNPETAFHKSVAWMWEQQSADGGWHSQTHAVLRDGLVLTPYILFHLLQITGEKSAREKERINKAFDFIVNSMQASISKDSNKLEDYPNYSAAYALRVLQKLDQNEPLQKIIADYLLSQQFVSHRGFHADSLAYGGWGYGESHLPFGKHGHVDVSHTRRITEALMEGGYLDDTLQQAVLLFLKGVQRHPEDPRLYPGCISRVKLPYDGGFVSSVVTLSTTKSHPVAIDSAGMHYPSYATATCDGFMALYALDKNSVAYADATQWLLEYQNMNTIDGLSEDDQGQWAEIMHYYHFAVRAEVMSMIDPNGTWKEKIQNILLQEQLPDGHFVNPIGGVNKEDDPLMATIFAIQAFGKINSPS